MRPRLQFSTRRLFLVTAVLAVWVAVFVIGYQLPIESPVLLPFVWAALLCAFLIPAALAAVIVRTLGKNSILAAFCGAAVYVAFIAWVSLVTWSY